MTKTKHFLSSLLVACCVVARADTTQTVTVAGDTAEGTVTEITFDGDDVTLAFSDGQTVTADMSEVSIDLTYGTSETGIASVAQDSRTGDGTIYNLRGQRVGNDAGRLAKGIYIIRGKKTTIK